MEKKITQNFPSMWYVMKTINNLEVKMGQEDNILATCDSSAVVE